MDQIKIYFCNFGSLWTCSVSQQENRIYISPPHHETTCKQLWWKLLLHKAKCHQYAILDQTLQLSGWSYFLDEQRLILNGLIFKTASAYRYQGYDSPESTRSQACPLALHTKPFIICSSNMIAFSHRGNTLLFPMKTSKAPSRAILRATLQQFSLRLAPGYSGSLAIILAPASYVYESMKSSPNLSGRRSTDSL